MHPVLAPHLHPMCKQAILDLEKCHRERSFAKFVGACNQAKYALDKCLSDEYLVKRELNAIQSKRQKQRLCDELEQEKRDAMQ